MEQFKAFIQLSVAVNQQGIGGKMTVASQAASTGSGNKTISGEDAKNRHQPKSIVMKKKDPQKSMKDFFRVTRPAGKKVERNFQGYPMDQCAYEPSIKKTVYRPPGWGGAEALDCPKEKCCDKCMLRPCFFLVKRVEIFKFAEAQKLFAKCEEDRENDAVYVDTMFYTNKIVMEEVGQRYFNKHGAPSCVQDAVFEKYPYENKPWLENEQPEECDGVL